jgi:hypothetical protein
MGLACRVGDNWLISAGVGYSVGIVATADTQDYLKTFISVSYHIHHDEDQKNEPPK